MRTKMFNLGIPQIRILKVLATAKGPMNRKMISVRADVGENNMTTMIGSLDVNKRDHIRKTWGNGYIPLLSLGYVAMIKSQSPDGGKREILYKITDKGRRIVQKVIQKEIEKANTDD